MGWLLKNKKKSYNVGSMKKRIADFLEKFAVAALAIGLFQGKGIAVALGSTSLAICLFLQRGIK